jgi:transcription termination/antitermination protein NusA
MSKTTDEQKTRNQLIAHLASVRGVSREELVAMLERTLREAARRAVRNYQNVDAKIDERGGITCVAHLTVVEKVVDPSLEISLEMARTKFPDAQLGMDVAWDIEVKEFGRIASQLGRQVFTTNLQEAEKRHVVSQFTGREGQLFNGTVSRRDKNGVWVTIENTEALMPPKGCIPGEQYEVGDHVTVLLKSLNPDKGGAGLIVNRSSPEFVVRLFEREVSEIADGTVEIKGVAREPGYRTKIAVSSTQSKVDPVGACVGIRGARVRMIVSELGGEKVDIINWDPDIRIYAENALKPAKLAKVFVEEQEDEKILQVRVAEDQLSLSIGKKGQNARLAAKLLGWKINIERVTAEEPTQEETMEQKIQAAAGVLAEATGVPQETALLLVANGYHSVEGLREATVQELAEIDGVGQEMAEKIVSALAAK